MCSGIHSKRMKTRHIKLKQTMHPVSKRISMNPFNTYSGCSQAHGIRIWLEKRLISHLKVEMFWFIWYLNVWSVQHSSTPFDYQVGLVYTCADEFPRSGIGNRCHLQFQRPCVKGLDGITLEGQRFRVWDKYCKMNGAKEKLHCRLHTPEKLLLPLEKFYSLCQTNGFDVNCLLRTKACNRTVEGMTDKRRQMHVAKTKWKSLLPTFSVSQKP